MSHSEPLNAVPVDQMKVPMAFVMTLPVDQMLAMFMKMRPEAGAIYGIRLLGVEEGVDPKTLTRMAAINMALVKIEVEPSRPKSLLGT